MSTETDIREFDAFLKAVGDDSQAPSGMAYPPSEASCEAGAMRGVSMKPPLFADGSQIGSWTVLGFLGRGGSGEVYRVRRGNEIAAAKVLFKDDPAARDRFLLEAETLERLGRGTRPACPRSCGTHDPTGPAFPRFIESSECSGHPYLITEFLQPLDLPRTDTELAEYLLEICRGLSELHVAGLVHRDLKPMNIMRRENGEVVIIDVGLVKDTWQGARPREGVSIVSGKAVAVGSPGYGAPEQFQGGTISPLTDIHALGRIANAAFDNHPPRNWEEIIRRSTSSIPEQRYGSVEEFAAAVRHRNDGRRVKTAALVLAACLVIAFGVTIWLGRDAVPSASAVGGGTPTLPESARWQSLCRPTVIARAEQRLLGERCETNNINGVAIVSPIRAYRTVTNRISSVVVNLNGGTNVFTHPLILSPGREYVFTGPGVFDADVTANGNAVTVRLAKCVFLNRSAKSLASSGIRYILDGGAYLNFTNLDRSDDYRNYILPFDAAFNRLDFKVPEDVQLGRARTPAAPSREIKFSKFPREILPTSSEYIVESVNTHEPIHLDPNRIPTDAEVDLVAFVFDVSREDARSILACRPTRVALSTAHGMLDAARSEVADV